MHPDNVYASDLRIVPKERSKVRKGSSAAGLDTSVDGQLSPPKAVVGTDPLICVLAAEAGDHQAVTLGVSQQSRAHAP